MISLLPIPMDITINGEITMDSLQMDQRLQREVNKSMPLLTDQGTRIVQIRLLSEMTTGLQCRMIISEEEQMTQKVITDD